MTYYDMVTNILRRLDELDPSRPARWTREEVLSHVNDAVAEYQLITWEMQGSAAFYANPGDNIYPVPRPVMVPTALSFAPAYNPSFQPEQGAEYLRRQTLRQMDEDVRWEAPAPDGNRIKIGMWSPLGFNNLLVYPRPHETMRVVVEGLTYVDRIDDVSDMSTQIPVLDQYLGAIEDWCVARAHFKEGLGELQQTNRMYTEFLLRTAGERGQNVAEMTPRFGRGAMDDDGTREQAEEVAL